MTPHIYHMIAYWFLFVMIIMLLFALARTKSERGVIEEQEIIIESQQAENDRISKEYDRMLKKKNDSIQMLERQVNILNDEVARLHGRPPHSFVKN